MVENYDFGIRNSSNDHGASFQSQTIILRIYKLFSLITYLNRKFIKEIQEQFYGEPLECFIGKSNPSRIYGPSEKINASLEYI